MSRFITTLAMSCCLSVTILVAAEGSDTLLKNGNFQVLNSRRWPASWQLYGAAQKLSVSKTDLPDGSNACLEIEVINPTKSVGSFGQIITGCKKNTTYRLTGHIRSSKPDMAFLQVKVKAGKKTLDRVDSKRGSANWHPVTIEFNSKDADKVSIQCRFSQDVDKGTKVWFSDLKLLEVNSDTAAN